MILDQRFYHWRESNIGGTSVAHCFSISYLFALVTASCVVLMRWALLLCFSDICISSICNQNSTFEGIWKMREFYSSWRNLTLNCFIYCKKHLGNLNFKESFVHLNLKLYRPLLFKKNHTKAIKFEVRSDKWLVLLAFVLFNSIQYKYFELKPRSIFL